MKLKRNQIINPVILILICGGLFLFFLQREKSLREEQALQLAKKEIEIKKLSDDWQEYKTQSEDKIRDLNAQINILRARNESLELKKQQVKYIYNEKYLEIDTYHAGNVVAAFDSIFSANNIK